MSESTPTAALPLSESDQRLWATLVHVGGIFFHFLPALVGYLVLKDRGAFIQQQTRTALNFQLTVLAGYIVGIFTSVIVVGFFLLIAVGALNIVFSIIAAVAANKGQFYAYPLTYEFIK